MNDSRSVETIDSPEFIDVRPYNPLISKCQIKVMYVGQNRNMSTIDKATAVKMADSLPSCPIVGWYKEDNEDFRDHGRSITIEDGDIKFNCKTVPYGFVAPDARVWFQKFTDTLDDGSQVEREYLMTEGYLWTGQFEEAKLALGGKGQSMEIENCDGEWATDPKTGLEFFIINDALFSKLCILGDDVAPCFEGASISAAPTEYAANENYRVFSNTLFTMMNQLKEALVADEESAERGLNMENEEFTSDEEKEKKTKEAEDNEDKASEEEDEQESEDKREKDFTEEIAPEVESAVESEPVPESEPVSEPEPEVEATRPETTDFSLTQLVSEVEALRKQNADLLSEVENLRAFKLQTENAEKDALIGKYFMLSDEDKADIVANKEALSFDEIEQKLALAYVKKNVDFSLAEDEMEADEAPALTFSLDEDTPGSVDFGVPEMIEALRDYRRENNTF